MSKELQMIKGFLLKKKQMDNGIPKTLLERRAEADAATIGVIKMPDGATTERVQVAGMPALWVRAANVPNNCIKTVLYYHGGGFFSGSAETHKGIAAAISQEACARVLVVDYRLWPEHGHPAAFEDALAAYRWLVDSGVAPANIALGGDSAGGMLVLATLLALRDEGSALPAAAVMLSPWLDIVDFNEETYISRADVDPMVELEESKREAAEYFGSEETRRTISTLQKDPRGLPPTLVQVGDCEVLLGEAQIFTQKAKAAGVDVTLEVWPELWHVFQAMTGMLPEARDAVGHIGRFLQGKLGLL